MSYKFLKILIFVKVIIIILVIVYGQKVVAESLENATTTEPIAFEPSVLSSNNENNIESANLLRQSINESESADAEDISLLANLNEDNKNEKLSPSASSSIYAEVSIKANDAETLTKANDEEANEKTLSPNDGEEAVPPYEGPKHDFLPIGAASSSDTAQEIFRGVRDAEIVSPSSSQELPNGSSSDASNPFPEMINNSESQPKYSESDAEINPEINPDINPDIKINPDAANLYITKFSVNISDCKEKFVTFLIYKAENNWNKSPENYKFNQAFECLAPTTIILDIPKLEQGNYVLLKAEQNETGPWRNPQIIKNFSIP